MGLFTNSMVKKETLLDDGKLILLELAPVDPRSLMQGDYMILNYGISRVVNVDSIAKRGFCVVRLDTDGIAELVRIQQDRIPLNVQEYLIAYTYGGRQRLNIGAESFFFQEGEGEKYEKANYGGLKVDDQGNSLLIGLYDKNHHFIE